MAERAKVYIGDDDTPIIVCGRDLWALRQLIKAGKTGCTPITRPAPRWSHYIWKLRKAGIVVETMTETHGGPYPGHHAVYVLRSPIRFDGGRVAA